MQGANKNINNPEEFYMDFFNNIIKRETVCEVKDSDKNINKACTFKKTVDSNPSPGDMKNRGVNKSKNKTIKKSSLINYN